VACISNIVVLSVSGYFVPYLLMIGEESFSIGSFYNVESVLYDVLGTYRKVSYEVL